MMALARGDRAAARVAFDRAIALNDQTVQPLQALVTLDLEEKKPEQARARVEQRLAKTPDNSAVLAVAGRTWAATGDLARAQAFLRRAVETDASNIEAYMDLARVYVAEQRLDQAVGEFDRVAARQPDAVGPQTMAALLVQSQGKTPDAQKRYERLVELHPRAAVASNNLAWILASRGEQLDRALQLAQTAKAEIPDHPEVNDTLGFVYLKKQLPALALPLLRLAVAKQPANPAFHYHLGLAYAGVGDKAAARQALEQALKLASNFDRADDARLVLGTLG
jgi:Tfp pilus assembly protein PilF